MMETNGIRAENTCILRRCGPGLGWVFESCIDTNGDTGLDSSTHYKERRYWSSLIAVYLMSDQKLISCIRSKSYKNGLSGNTWMGI